MDASIILDFKDYNNSRLLLSFLLIALGLTFVSSYTLMSDDLYYEFFGDQLPYEKIESIIQQQNKWYWVIYIVLPMFYLLKFLIVSCVMFLGLFIAGEIIQFKYIFKAAIVAEFIFLLPVIIKFIWFGFIYQDYSLQDLQYFAPLSLATLFNLPALPDWLIPFLQSLNVYLVLYILLLTYGLATFFAQTFNKMFTIAIGSIGSAYLLWQVFIMFVMINFSV